MLTSKFILLFVRGRAGVLFKTFFLGGYREKEGDTLTEQLQRHHSTWEYAILLT